MARTSYSYRPYIWYFEIIEMVRKLVMASILVFVYEGTPLQVITGFIVTLVSLLLSLYLRPFFDDDLQEMYQWALFVQTLTLLSGVMIKTDQFTEILGEKGDNGIAELGNLLIALHFLVGFVPIISQAITFLRLRLAATQPKCADVPALSGCLGSPKDEEVAEAWSTTTFQYTILQQKQQMDKLLLKSLVQTDLEYQAHSQMRQEVEDQGPQLSLKTQQTSRLPHKPQPNPAQVSEEPELSPVQFSSDQSCMVPIGLAAYKCISLPPPKPAGNEDPSLR